MNPWGLFSAAIAASYLLGAVPNGLLLSRLAGVDVRTRGSGNIGATNVFRSVSKPLGILTFVCDFLKGFLPARLIPLLPADLDPHTGVVLGTLCGVAAIAGHNWPVYLRFKGGKGVATSAGVLCALVPAALGIGLLAWLVVFLVSRYVSLASLAAALTVTGFGWFRYMKSGLFLPITLTALCILVLVRHRANIQRLRSGTENRFNFSRSKGDTP